MCGIDGPIGAPTAASLRGVADIGAKLGCESAKARVLRLESRQFAGSFGFRRFAISHRTTHPDRKSRQDEAKAPSAEPM